MVFAALTAATILSVLEGSEAGPLATFLQAPMNEKIGQWGGDPRVSAVGPIPLGEIEGNQDQHQSDKCEIFAHGNLLFTIGLGEDGQSCRISFRRSA